jgi:hypothetical protein
MSLSENQTVNDRIKRMKWGFVFLYFFTFFIRFFCYLYLPHFLSFFSSKGCVMSESESEDRLMRYCLFVFFFVVFFFFCSFHCLNTLPCLCFESLSQVTFLTSPMCAKILPSRTDGLICRKFLVEDLRLQEPTLSPTFPE